METGTWSELCEAGEAHYRNGEYGEAVRCYRKASEETPTNVTVLVKFGFACVQDGNLLEAIGAFKTAIGLNPQEHDAFLGIGLAYKGNADFARAIASFDQALEIQPNSQRAREELVRCLVQDGTIRVSSNDLHGGEQCLERAYKLSRSSPDTIVPFVEHLITSGQHKKAFDVIGQAKKDASQDPRVLELATRMDNDPKLAHAKQISSLRSAPTLQSKAQVQPARPQSNPDEIACPCGAARVMKWATVCPTCNNRIGDPNNRMSSFAGRDTGPSTTWVEVVYYIVAVIWLLVGAGTFLLGLAGGAEVGTFSMGVGAFNAGIALGLLFQVEWVQFIAKILMILNLIIYGLNFILLLGLGSVLVALVYLVATVFSGFSVYVIHQMSD